MIRFLSIASIRVMHSDLLREFGGLSGERDLGLLESAIDRAKNLYLYQEASIFTLAAAYAFGITKNHPFVDGNKRVGLIAAYAFLRINGIELTASEEEAVIVMIGVADSTVDEKTLAAWLKSHSESSKN